jgi:Domain of unknown function (DUF4919)
MRELFLEFLQEPSPERFWKLREAVISHPQYNGYSTDLDELQQFNEQGRHSEVRAKFASSIPNLLLSPRAHMLVSLSARAQEDMEDARTEGFICHRCLEGILRTGSGSEESPYHVLRTSDEYDVLFHFGKNLLEQQLVHRDDRCFDVLVCEDGAVLWFDITEMLRCLAR